MKKFYTYIYLDPRYPGKYKYEEYEFDYKPFYVGKGTGTRCYRQAEKARIHKLKPSFKRSYLKKLFNLGLKPIIIKVHDNISEELALEKEIKLIKLIGRRKYNEGYLTNISEGGDGLSGWIMPKEARNKISKAHKDKPLVNEHKIKLSKANKNNVPWNKGLSVSDETRKRLSRSSSKIEHWKQGNKYIITTPENKEIECYELEKFCEDNNLRLSSMRLILQNRLKEHNGYKIRLTEKYKVISPEGEEIDIQSLELFCKEKKLRTHSLRQVANGKRVDYLGWKCIRL